MAELSKTAYVILGFLQRDPMSGYDIKQKIEVSTRFFFTSSYGQIYPELKRLEAQGLIQGVAKQNGARARTEYTLTTSGREELERWLVSPGDGVEMRDESILKYFFSSELGRDDQIARLKALKAERQKGLATLREVERTIAHEIPDTCNTVLDYGLELHEFIIGWADRQLAELESPNPQKALSVTNATKE